MALVLLLLLTMVESSCWLGLFPLFPLLLLPTVKKREKILGLDSRRSQYRKRRRRWGREGDQLAANPTVGSFSKALEGKVEAFAEAFAIRNAPPVRSVLLGLLSSSSLRSALKKGRWRESLV